MTTTLGYYEPIAADRNLVGGVATPGKCFYADSSQPVSGIQKARPISDSEKALRLSPTGLFCASDLEVESEPASDFNAQVTLLKDIANVKERAFAGHAQSSLLIDFVGRHDIQPQKIILVGRFADFEKDCVFMGVQAEIPAVIRTTMMATNLCVNESLIDEAQQLLGLVVACSAKIAFFICFRMPE